MKIVLLGYMASGKSLIGKKLSTILDYKFIDLDNYIEDKEGKSISKIFLEEGEIYFRRVEHSCLKEILKTKENIVLSLGGGTPCYFDNMKIISEANSVNSIFLNVTIPEIASRLQSETSTRPIVSHIKNKEDLLEFIGKHLFERSKFYRQADLIIDGNQEPDLITETIILNLF